MLHSRSRTIVQLCSCLKTSAVTGFLPVGSACQAHQGFKHELVAAVAYRYAEPELRAKCRMSINYEWNTWLCPNLRGASLLLTLFKSIKPKEKALFIPLILLVTCSLDVTIWSMSVRSLASSGTLWPSHDSTSSLYCPVVWHKTCLYTASEICRENHSVTFGLSLFCLESSPRGPCSGSQVTVLSNW